MLAVCVGAWHVVLVASQPRITRTGAGPAGDGGGGDGEGTSGGGIDGGGAYTVVVTMVGSVADATKSESEIDRSVVDFTASVLVTANACAASDTATTKSRRTLAEATVTVTSATATPIIAAKAAWTADVSNVLTSPAATSVMVTVVRRRSPGESGGMGDGSNGGGD